MNNSNAELFYVGTFSDLLYVMQLDIEKEELKIINQIEKARRPAYLTFSKEKSLLYVANEFSNGTGGVSVYDLKDNLRPSLINSIHSNTAGPCHVSLAEVDGKKYLLSAGYFDGQVGLYPISSDGSIIKNSLTIQLHGSGPIKNHPGRLLGQEQSRAHYIIQVSGTNFVLCTDLGSDKIMIYRLINDKLVENGFCCMWPGTGPRHLLLHPSGELVYLITELSSTIVVLEFDRDHGMLQPIQYISTLPDNYTKDSWTAAIHLSMDGRFLYGSNRGHDSIAIFSVEGNGKRVEKVGYLTEMINCPRDFQIDPSGRYMIVANQDSNMLSLYRLNNGIPEFSGKTIKAEQPSCIAFL